MGIFIYRPLLEMKKAKDKAVEKGKESLSYYHYYKFDKKYDELIGHTGNEILLPEITEKTWTEEKVKNPYTCRVPCGKQGVSLPCCPQFYYSV